MKRVFAITLVVLTAVLIWFFGKMLPDFFTTMGKTAYVKGDYVEAFDKLKLATRLSPKNRDARYYYVQTLMKLKPTLEVQRELFTLSQNDFSDSADLIADRQISKWRNQITLGSGSNYIEQAPMDSKILRWDVKKFPLKVYIKNSSSKQIPQYYDSEIKKAFVQWQKSTNNLVKFEFVNDSSASDIQVDIVSSDSGKSCKDNDCKYVVAHTSPDINGDLLKKMTIIFYDSNNLGQPFSQKDVYNTALHEIGHSLGIMGHSYDKDDVMYMESDGGEDVFSAFKSGFQALSYKDLNTIVLLYRLIPDISNTHLIEFDTSGQFFAPIVMGNEKEITSRKILEAQNYIKAAPNLPNGYIDLSAAYSELKQYNEAVNALNQALALCSNDDELYVVYYNFTVLYYNLKDFNEALSYAQKAKQVQPDSDIEGLVAAIYFEKGDRELAKQTYISNLSRHPENTIDAINLSRIYLKEFNLVQAGKTLNNLVKANPEAASDSRVKIFSILMFFFR